MTTQIEPAHMAYKPHITFVARCAAVLLLALALFKLHYLVGSPQRAHDPDPVLKVLTAREALLVGAFFEAVLAYAILQCRRARWAGLLILYFSVCVTLYQIGVVLTGADACSCLGTATDWVGNWGAALVTRSLLLLFWAAGLWLVWQPEVPQKAECQFSHIARRSCCLLAAAALAWMPSGTAQTLWVEGHFAVTEDRGAKVVRDVRPFQAWIDENALLITSHPPVPSRYGIQGPCGSQRFISKEVLLSHMGCSGDRHAVAFERVEHAWELGNCGSTLESCVFLSLRCAEMFPHGSDSRRLAPPWTTTAEGVGLIQEVRYRWLDTEREEQVLTGDISVSEALLQEWTTSPLGSPLLTNPEVLRMETRVVQTYQAGFLSGHVRFAQFTNVAGRLLPRQADWIRFYPVNPTNRVDPATQPTARLEVTLDRIEPVGHPVAILPIEAQTISVVDHRLSDASLGIAVAQYQTNVIRTFEISPLAVMDFEKRRVQALERLRIERRRRILVTLLGVVALLSPVLMIYVARSRRTVPT